MAPVYLSASRRLAFVFVLFLLFCLSVERVATLHIYDREYLLSIRNLVTDVRVWNSCGQKPLESALLARLPANICCTADCSLHRRKRHRKRGKRGGVLARLKNPPESLSDVTSRQQWMTSVSVYHQADGILRPPLQQSTLLFTMFSRSIQNQRSIVEQCARGFMEVE